MNSSLKVFLRLLFALVIIGFVCHNIDLQQIRYLVSKPELLLLIPFAWLANQLLVTQRLNLILHSLGFLTKYSVVFRANMSALFIGNLIPGVVGADLIKFFFIKKSYPELKRVELAVILLIDRLLGLFAVFFWCAFFAFVLALEQANEITSEQKILYFFPIIGLLAIIAFSFVFKCVINYLSNCFNYRFLTLANDVLSTARKLLNDKAILVVMLYNFSATFVILFALVIVGGELQYKLGHEPQLMLQFYLVPLVLISTMIPLTPLGIGVAQFTMAEAYSFFGLESSVGISVSTISQFSLLFVSIIIGGFSFVFKRVKLRDIHY